MVKFTVENWNTIIKEGAQLLDKHYKEVSHFLDIPLNPNHEKYLHIEANGNLKVFIARDENENLLGYAVFFLNHNLHYMGSFQAVQDIIFIDPEKRGFGRTFIKYCDEELKKLGVQVVYHHVKNKKELNFSPMLERDGYELIDLIYGKRLDKR